jgi:hypothetical protein
MAEQTLNQMQQWMKTVITTRGDLKQKLEYAADIFNLKIDEVVESKRGVSAQKRLDIYAAGYVLRLLECMKCDFPGLQAFMGEEVFEVFAKAYIVSLPSQSWSLFKLSERFPQFLLDTQPKNDLENKSLLELPAEIAAFERAKAEVVYIKGTEEFPEQNIISEVEPMNFLLDENFIQASPCLRLLKQKFPLNNFLNQLQQGEFSEPPEEKTTYMAITRKNYRLRMAELEEWQYVFLNSCKQSISIHTCAKKAAEESGVEVKIVLAKLLIWLPIALEMGCLTRSINN